MGYLLGFGVKSLEIALHDQGKKRGFKAGSRYRLCIGNAPATAKRFRTGFKCFIHRPATVEVSYNYRFSFLTASKIQRNVTRGGMMDKTNVYEAALMALWHTTFIWIL